MNTNSTPDGISTEPLWQSDPSQRAAPLLRSESAPPPTIQDFLLHHNIPPRFANHGSYDVFAVVRCSAEFSLPSTYPFSFDCGILNHAFLWIAVLDAV